MQSTYSPTLKAIRRKTDWPHLRNRIKCLQEMGNFHLHVDLIAGLPHESYYQFAHSFNEVFYLQPDVIQLGFLKMLKGSPLCDQAAHYQYIFQNHSPYEVLSNNVISFAELDRLHMIEEMLVRFYNSRHFKATIEHLTQKPIKVMPFNALRIWLNPGVKTIIIFVNTARKQNTDSCLNSLSTAARKNIY